MARSFTTSSTQYLATTSTPITSVPFSAACWFWYDNDTTGVLWGVGDSGGTYQYNIYLNVGGVDLLTAWRVGSEGSDAAVGGGITKSTWTHVALVVAAANDITLYNNGSGTNNTTTITPANWDRMTIGCEPDSNRGTYLDHIIAEVGLWNIALSQAEVNMLVAGFAPPAVRPDALECYWPLIRTDQDLVGGYDMTAYNSPTFAAHCPNVVYRVSPYIVPIPTVAEPSEDDIIALAMNQYRRRRV